MTEDIKDSHGKLIGKRISNGSLTELRDAKGNTLGRYSFTSDLTYDCHGRLVGKGDQTMRLIKD
jgi:hypothetical protein